MEAAFGYCVVTIVSYDTRGRRRLLRPTFQLAGPVARPAGTTAFCLVWLRLDETPACPHPTSYNLFTTYHAVRTMYYAPHHPGLRKQRVGRLQIVSVRAGFCTLRLLMEAGPGSPRRRSATTASRRYLPLIAFPNARFIASWPGGVAARALAAPAEWGTHPLPKAAARGGDGARDSRGVGGVTYVAHCAAVHRNGELAGARSVC